MSATLQPVAATLGDPEDWPAIAGQLTRATGLPVVADTDALTAFVAGAVPLLYEADRARDGGPLRGSFADPVLAQVQRNAPALGGAVPTGVTITLAASRVIDGHAVIRVHLAIGVRTPTGASAVQRQFWDLQLGGEATVAATTCSGCGAPLAAGELLCRHCGADARVLARPPVLVSRLEHY